MDSYIFVMAEVNLFEKTASNPRLFLATRPTARTNSVHVAPVLINNAVSNRNVTLCFAMIYVQTIVHIDFFMSSG